MEGSVSDLKVFKDIFFRQSPEISKDNTKSQSRKPVV
jgi:hypothetical protein